MFNLRKANKELRKEVGDLNQKLLESKQARLDTVQEMSTLLKLATEIIEKNIQDVDTKSKCLLELDKFASGTLDFGTTIYTFWVPDELRDRFIPLAKGIAMDAKVRFVSGDYVIRDDVYGLRKFVICVSGENRNMESFRKAMDMITKR
jgi:hypothetical protein